MNQYQNLQQSIQKIGVNRVKCQNDHRALFVCSKRNCDSYAFICGEKNCQCSKKHKHCLKLLIQSMQSLIFQNTFSSKQIQQKIQDVFQKAINQLSQYRDALLTDLKQKYQCLGMSKQQKTFIDSLKNGSTKQITCSFIWNLTKTFDTKQQQQKNVNIVYQQIQKVWKQFQTKVQLFNRNIKHIYQKFNKNTFCCLQFYGSKVIQTGEVDKINSFFENQDIVQTKLLYRASQQLYSVQRFHQLCDNIPNTLIVCKTEFGKVVGAYTCLKWNRIKTQYTVDNEGKSFIFSLTNNDKFTLKVPQNAIYNSPTYGPTFGAGHNFHVSDKANQNQNSYVYVYDTYTNAKYTVNNKQTYQKLGGNPNNHYGYKIAEWEVWQVQLKRRI